MTSRLWIPPVVGAVLATLVTWLSMIAYPGWVIPPYELTRSIDIWASQAFWFTVFTVAALFLGSTDTFLGLGLFLLGAGILLWGGVMDITHRLVVLAGALILWAMRHIPLPRRQLVVRILAASGLFQALYVCQQAFLNYDFFYGPVFGGTLIDHVRPTGTLGTVDAAAAYIAITAPLMPWWCLPIPVAAVVIGDSWGHSLGAIAALTTGLLVRYHRNWTLTAGLVTAIGAAALYGFARVQQGHIPSTVLARLEVAGLAIRDWWSPYPLIGYLPNVYEKAPYWPANPVTGNGPWWPRIALLQKHLGVSLTQESFREGHNEWLQWGYEYGLAGLACLGGWLVRHRRMFKAEYGVGAALIAGAVNAGSFFIFQIFGTALLMLVLIGIATPFARSQEAAS